MSPCCPVSYHTGCPGDLVFLLFASEGFFKILMLVWMLRSLSCGGFTSSLTVWELMHADSNLPFTSSLLRILFSTLLCCVENSESSLKICTSHLECHSAVAHVFLFVSTNNEPVSSFQSRAEKPNAYLKQQTSFHFIFWDMASDKSSALVGGHYCSIQRADPVWLMQ